MAALAYATAQQRAAFASALPAVIGEPLAYAAWLRPAPHSRSVSRTDRQARYRSGVRCEQDAKAILVAKGYRILAERFLSAAGEIDLIAVRGRRVALVEVKRRRSLNEAAFAVTAKQCQRIAAAGEIWLSQNPDYAEHEVSIDMVLGAPGASLSHVENIFFG